MVTAMVMAMATRLIFRIEDQRQICFGLLLGVFTFPSFAGDWKITPTFAVNETATNNLYLSSSNAKSALISDINPGISIDGKGGRAKLRLSYQMHNLFYSTDPSRNNQTQNSLNAFGTVEALENWLFIDARGNISQQSISAFGASSASSSTNTNINNNISETSTYQVSPYVRGSFGGVADYQLRYNWSTTSTQAGSAFDSTTKEWIASLKGAARLANFGWAVDGSAMTFDQGNLRSKEDNRIRGVLSYQISPQFQVSLIGGREENNYQSLNKEGFNNYGAGFEWLPTERTRMDFSREERFFGPSNTFSFSHRTARTAWKMSSSKDVNSQQGQQSVNLGTNYDLLYSIFSPAFPTPEAAAAFVNAYLLANGISPNAQLQSGFLTNQTVVQQLRNLSFALLGARNTVTVAAAQNDSQNLTVLNGLGVGIGSGPSQNNVNQISASISWSHKLTPKSSLIGTISRSNSKGTGTNTLETTQQLMSLNFVTSLGPKTNAGVGARHVISDGTTDYSETALTATMSHRF